MAISSALQKLDKAFKQGKTKAQLKQQSKAPSQTSKANVNPALLKSVALQKAGMTGVALTSAAKEEAAKSGISVQEALKKVSNKAATGGYTKQEALKYGEAGRQASKVQLAAKKEKFASGKSQQGASKSTYGSPPPKRPAPDAEMSVEDQLRQDLAYQKQMTQYEQGQKETAFKDLGNVSTQVASFSEQLQSQQQQVQDLINNLNSKQQGLGDKVQQALQDVAASGGEAYLDENVMKYIEKTALRDGLESVDSNVRHLVENAAPPPITQPQGQAPQEAIPSAQPLAAPAISQSQQYESLQQSGMNAGQIVQQNPNLYNQAIPDGSIINTKTGVGIVQIGGQEAYKTQSGILIPKDPSTGFYNLAALGPEDQQKLSYLDILAIDLSTKKTTSDLKNMYTAEFLQNKNGQIERDKALTDLQIASFYDSENNRLNESEMETMQTIELEKMRQELSKDTSLQQLDQAKQKTANIMKAQMDAWGLEGSSTVIAAMSAHSLKFEQEASNITKAYDINIKELALASSRAQIGYTNRITELNQKKQVDQMTAQNDYFNKRDALEESVLMSKLEKTVEEQNMYSEYTQQVFSYNEQVKADAAAAEQAAREDIWEREKWYSEKMGMMVAINESGVPQPMLDQNGKPILTFDASKFGTEQDLAERQFNFMQDKFGIETAFGQERWQTEMTIGQEQWANEFTLDQQKFGLDQQKYSFEELQYYQGLKQYDSIDWNEDLGAYIGKTKDGVVNLGPNALSIPSKSVYDFDVSPNGIAINVEMGKLPPNGRGQCGAFANDVLFGGSGRGGFGDFIKTDIANLGNSDSPVAGGAFMMYLDGGAGHKGIVESVNPDGSYTIVHSNWDKKGTLRRDVVHPGDYWDQKMTKFHDPNPNAPKQNEAGLYNQFLKQAKMDGLSGKAAKDFAKDMYDQSYSAPTQSQASAYNAFIKAQAENEIYSNISMQVGPEKLTESMDYINRKIGDPLAPFTGELINKFIKDDTTRQAIMSEYRWVSGVLRWESGAAISVGEYISMGAQYFPRAGDDQGSIEIKAEARKRIESGALFSAGPSGQRKFAEENASKPFGYTLPGMQGEAQQVESSTYSSFLPSSMLTGLSGGF